jgi:hypothetical protein
MPRAKVAEAEKARADAARSEAVAAEAAEVVDPWAVLSMIEPCSNTCKVCSSSSCSWASRVPRGNRVPQCLYSFRSSSPVEEIRALLAQSRNGHMPPIQKSLGSFLATRGIPWHTVASWDHSL